MCASECGSNQKKQQLSQWEVSAWGSRTFSSLFVERVIILMMAWVLIMISKLDPELCNSSGEWRKMFTNTYLLSTQKVHE